MRGICEALASITAGKRLPTAVPEVTMMATGLKDALAWPKAWKARLLSSKWMNLLAMGWLATARVKGVDLEPGAMQKYLTP